MKFIRSIFFALSMFVFISCSNTEAKKNVSVVSISHSSLERVEPPNWWIDFNDTSLQLLVKEDNIGSSTPSISYAGVSITKVHKAKSPNYLFIDVEIDKNTKPRIQDCIRGLHFKQIT